MDVIVERVVRRGKKTSRVLLSTGETVVLPTQKLPAEGEVYSSMVSSDGVVLRPLLPGDSFPSLLDI